MNGSFNHRSLPLTALTGTSGRGYRPARSVVLGGEHLDFRAFFQHPGRLRQRSGRGDAGTDLDHPFTLIAKLDLGPLGRVAVGNEDVVEAVFFDDGAFRNQDCVGFRVGANFHTDEGTGAEALLGFERDR